MDRALQYPLPPGSGWHLDAVRAAHCLHHRAGGDGRVGGDREARGAVHGCFPDSLRPDDRRVLRPRWCAVLCVLRGHADSDVRHHWRLGRAEPCVCGVQIFPVHTRWFTAHPRRDHLPVSEVRRQFRHCHLACLAARAAGAEDDLLRVPACVCRQGADVASAHMAARCPRRSAYRRLGGVGSDHAQTGCLRFPSLLVADCT